MMPELPLQSVVGGIVVGVMQEQASSPYYMRNYNTVLRSAKKETRDNLIHESKTDDNSMFTQKH